MARVVSVVDAALALVLLGATPEVQARDVATRAAPSVRGAREVLLDEKTIRTNIEVRTARNLLTTVEFPLFVEVRD